MEIARRNKGEWNGNDNKKGEISSCKDVVKKGEEYQNNKKVGMVVKVP